VPVLGGWLGEAGKGSVPLCVPVPLHPGERLSPGLRRVREAGAWWHGAARDVPRQLSRTSCGSWAGTMQQRGKHHKLQLPEMRALPGKWDQLSRAGSPLCRGSERAVSINRCLFLKRLQGLFVLCPASLIGFSASAGVIDSTEFYQDTEYLA